MVEAINGSPVPLDSRIEVLDPLTLVVHTHGWWLVVCEILGVTDCSPASPVHPIERRSLASPA